MGQPIIQPSFAAGELSPSLWARVDLAKFHVAAGLLKNWFVDYRGGASTRAGTMFVGPCLSGINRLIPFTFSTVQTYALLFSNLKMRVIKDGAFVLEASQNITGITQADPGVLAYSGADPANGDWMYLSGIGGMTRLNGRYVVVTNVNAGANTFELYDTNGNPIDTRTFAAFTSGGTMSRVYTIASPYAAADLALLKFTQSADTMTICHPSYAPRQLTRTGHTSWSFSTITFAPSQAAPTSPSVTGSTTGGTTTYRYVVTAVSSNGVTESVPSASAEVTDSDPMSTTPGANCEVSFTGASGAQYYNVYRQQEVIDGAPDPGSLYGYVGTTTSTSFTDANILPDFTNTPPIAYNPFGSSNNYPSCTTYFQGRQVFAATNNRPQGIWFSKSGDFLNMDYSNPSKADDAIEQTLVAQQVNAIKHLVPLTSLLPLTASGSWKADGGSQSDIVTPSSFVALPQSYNGCSDVPPLVIGSDVLYVQAKGSTVRDLSYNFYNNVFNGVDMSVLSNHLFVGRRITEWAYAEEPYKMAWAVRDDGIALTFTYLKEQDVYAWTRHDTDGRFKSVCSISEGDEDAVYFVIERLVNGEYVKYVERLASRNMGGDPSIGIPGDINRAWFVDSGLRYPMTYPNATVTPSALSAEAAVADTNIVDGGTGYTAPVASVVDLEGQGSGADISLTVVGGVITAATVVDGGSGYVRPEVQITDDTGSGAVISAILENNITLEADSAIFTTGDVGKTVRVNGGIGTVVARPDTTHITVDLIQSLTSLWPALPGEWTMTEPVQTVAGLDHLEGKTVVILANGNVVSPQVVTDGEVSLPAPADAIVIGLAYTPELVSLYLDIPGESPTVQGKRKKISAVTLRVQNTRGLKVGVRYFDNAAAATKTTELREIKERNFQTMGQPIQLITGDERITIDPLWSVQGQVVVQQDYPLPATVLGLIPEVTVGDN